MTEHYVETFHDPDGYGWQCFTCRAEDRGYRTFDQAEQDGIHHAMTAPT